MDCNKEPGLCYNYFEDAFDSGPENDFSILKGCHVGYARREISFSNMQFLVATFQ